MKGPFVTSFLTSFPRSLYPILSPSVNRPQGVPSGHGRGWMGTDYIGSEDPSEEANGMSEARNLGSEMETAERNRRRLNGRSHLTAPCLVVTLGHFRSHFVRLSFPTVSSEP